MTQDIFAINLLRDFVKEKLDGDIHKLRTYDLKTLSDDQKYGDNIIERAPIVKAMMSLAFIGVWPELSVDAFNKGKFECDTINKYQNLFGINMCEQYFKGMQKFNPSSFQHQRALMVAHLTDSVGNLWVLPCSPSITSRILDNSYRYYMDKFLLSIYNVLTEKKRVDKTLQSIISKNKIMAIYKGEDGFEKFIQDMMLNDFLDYYGKPTEIFPFVWSAMKDLDKDTYFDAVDKFCTFCEKFIPKRADMIIAKLSNALSNTPSIQKPIGPNAVTERTQPKGNECQEESIILNRYALAYQFITLNLGYVKGDVGKRLPLLADKVFLMTMAEKMGLHIEGFSWNDLSISIENIDDDFIAIFYVFPKPRKEPEALYGAVLFDRSWETLTYYTLEMCSHQGRWALGKNTSERHALIGMYDMEPTKENFLKMIVSRTTENMNIDIQSLLHLPDNFKVLEKMQEDPSGCVTYGMSTESCNALIQVYPISERAAMPFDDNAAIINRIHHSLKDEQALVEVKSGRTKTGRPFVYSIVKTKMEKSGVGYFLLMHVAYENCAISVKAHFLEKGMTGYRDATIWELAFREGIVSTDNQDKWRFDPYNKDFKHPFLMNLSEKEEFDEFFPEHPLTQVRQFAKLITEKL